MSEDSYLAAVERLSAKRGVTPDEFIEEAGRRLDSYEYPTANCLLPEDIVAFSSTGTLMAQQRSHADSCHFCRDLLQALMPSEARIAALRNTVTTPGEKPELALPLGAMRAGKRPRSKGLAWSVSVPAAAIGGFLCVLAVGWTLMTRQSVFERTRIETLCQEILLSPDVLAIDSSSSASLNQALREFLKRPSAEAYTQVVTINNESVREVRFRNALAHELGHLVVGHKASPSVLVVRYQGVEAQVGSALLFNKLDQQRDYVLTSHR